jgi:hypothetical protein
MEVIVAHLKTLLLRRATKLEPTAVCLFGRVER